MAELLFAAIKAVYKSSFRIGKHTPIKRIIASRSDVPKDRASPTYSRINYCDRQ